MLREQHMSVGTKTSGLLVLKGFIAPNWELMQCMAQNSVPK